MGICLSSSKPIKCYSPQVKQPSRGKLSSLKIWTPNNDWVDGSSQQQLQQHRENRKSLLGLKFHTLIKSEGYQLSQILIKSQGKSVFFHGLTPQWQCRIIMKIRTKARMITIQGTCWSWSLQIDHVLSRSRTDSRSIHSQAHKTVKEHSQPCSQSPPLFLREILPAMRKHDFCQGKLFPWP